jgi:WD40 repeat protein
VEDGNNLIVLHEHHAHGINSTAFTPDGRTLASAGSAFNCTHGSVRLWNPYEVKKTREKQAKKTNWVELYQLWG